LCHCQVKDLNPCVVSDQLVTVHQVEVAAHRGSLDGGKAKLLNQNYKALETAGL
jgi:hypothetical protein